MYEVYVLVEKKKSIFLRFFTVFSYAMAAVSALFVVLGAYIFVPSAVFGILIGCFLQTRNYEYEYSYFDGDVRFAKIINKANRKNLPGYTMEEVVAIAPMGDASIAQYEKDTHLRIRRLNSGFAGRELYVMVAKGAKGVELVHFEPDQKYLDAICVKYGYKVRR